MSERATRAKAERRTFWALASVTALLSGFALSYLAKGSLTWATLDLAFVGAGVFALAFFEEAWGSLLRLTR